MVGAPLGNLVLTRIAPEPMRWAISAIVLTAVALLASGWRFSGQWRPTVTLGIGVTSGFLNGLSGMAGPPIAFYYLAGNETVKRVRANLTTYFVFVDLAALLVFAGRGLVHWETGVLALCLAPAVIAGACWARSCFLSPARLFIAASHSCLLVAVAIGSLIL